MEVKVSKIDEEKFEVLLGETRIELDFDSKLSSASDSGIQSLLRTASHDDILVLLHSSEKDTALKKKLYGNMSENSIKMYIEDMLFQFSDGVKSYQFDEAMTRLIKTVETLVEQGALTYDESQ